MLDRQALRRENLQLRSALARAANIEVGVRTPDGLLTALAERSGFRAAAGLDSDWPTLEVLQARYVDRVLARTQGNRTQTASILGIDRRTVQRLMARAKALKKS